jgi:hypothetical protein
MEGAKVRTRHRRIQRMPRRVERFMLRHPVAVVLTAVLGAVVALCYTATHLEFDSNRLDLISAGEHYTHLEAAFSREFADLPGSMVVVMQSQHPERAKAFATALAQRWETDAHIAQVLSRIDVDTLRRKGLLYLSPDQLTELRQQLQAHHAFLHALAASPTLHTLFTLVNQEVTKALVSHLFTGFLQEDTVQEKPPDLSLLLTLLQQMNTWLEGSRRYQSPWASVLTESADAVSPDGFLWSDDHQLLFVFVRPKASVSDVSGFRTAIQRVQADVRALHHAYPETAVGLTGSALLDSDEGAGVAGGRDAPADAGGWPPHRAVRRDDGAEGRCRSPAGLIGVAGGTDARSGGAAGPAAGECTGGAGDGCGPPAGAPRALYRGTRPLSDYCLSSGQCLGISTADPVRQGRQIGGSRCPRHPHHEF